MWEVGAPLAAAARLRSGRRCRAVAGCCAAGLHALAAVNLLLAALVPLVPPGAALPGCMPATSQTPPCVGLLLRGGPLLTPPPRLLVPPRPAAADMPLHALNKLPYGKLAGHKIGVREGVMFLTYSSLISSAGAPLVLPLALLPWLRTLLPPPPLPALVPLLLLPTTTAAAAAVSVCDPLIAWWNRVPTLLNCVADSGRSRFKQLVEWCGKDFDGLIIFDESECSNHCLCYPLVPRWKQLGRRLEDIGSSGRMPDLHTKACIACPILAMAAGLPAPCLLCSSPVYCCPPLAAGHKAKNLVAEGGMRSTQVGLRVRDLQVALPQARIVYCSATGASGERGLELACRARPWRRRH